MDGSSFSCGFLNHNDIWLGGHGDGGDLSRRTRDDVAADDLPTQSGQRLGHDCDDAAAGGLDVGGPTAGGCYSSADARANSGSCIGGLGSCGLSDQFGGHDGSIATDNHNG